MYTVKTGGRSQIDIHWTKYLFKFCSCIISKICVLGFLLKYFFIMHGDILKSYNVCGCIIYFHNFHNVYIEVYDFFTTCLMDICMIFYYFYNFFLNLVFKEFFQHVKKQLLQPFFKNCYELKEFFQLFIQGCFQ